MKIVYFISLLIVAMFFNACGNSLLSYADSNPIIQSPEQIDSFAIPPSNENNLFSPPKNGYARLIIYGHYNVWQHSIKPEIFIKYEPITDGVDYDNRALCVIGKNSSCIVNIKANNSIMIYSPSNRTFMFTPKNQHTYCINVLPRNFLPLIEPKLNEYYRNMNAFNKPAVIIAMNFEFKDKNTCLKEYKEIYKPRHRKEQERWLNKLIKKGDKRAYQE